MGQPQISGRQVGIRGAPQSTSQGASNLRELKDVDVNGAQEGDVLTLKKGIWKPSRRKRLPQSSDLSRASVKVAIDAAAERARMRYLTSGAGQAQVYLEKVEEAADYIAADYPSECDGYPYIQAEINATGKTARQVADDIIAAKSAWQAVSVQIEEARLGGKRVIEEATNTQDIKSARDSTIASLDAI